MKHPATWHGGAPGAYGVLVHGGAGGHEDGLLPERERACGEAANAAREILVRGGSALDAVQRAVELMEDAPSLNAGTGGSLTEDGRLELDAAIMEGTGLGAGAVCALPPFRNPIAIARAVLEDGEHVLYAADGARAFALARGYRAATPDEMITQLARIELAEVLAERAKPQQPGTVGAVARDQQGRLAAATSTGGITAKRHGRIGDSPILGAGTYADDARGAISCTGEGEGFLRVTMASRVLTEMDLGRAPDDAAARALAFLERRLDKRGGLIAMSPHGVLAWARNTPHMPCAYTWNGQPVSTAR